MGVGCGVSHAHTRDDQDVLHAQNTAFVSAPGISKIFDITSCIVPAFRLGVDYAKWGFHCEGFWFICAECFRGLGRVNVSEDRVVGKGGKLGVAEVTLIIVRESLIL